MNMTYACSDRRRLKAMDVPCGGRCTPIERIRCLMAADRSMSHYWKTNQKSRPKVPVYVATGTNTRHWYRLKHQPVLLACVKRRKVTPHQKPVPIKYQRYRLKLWAGSDWPMHQRYRVTARTSAFGADISTESNYDPVPMHVLYKGTGWYL